MTQMTMPSPQDIDPDYHWNFVRFTGRFFCVPDYRFIEGSDYFVSEYDLKSGSITPSTDFEVVDMNADKPPQVIDLDVTIKDFRPFLTVLYPKTADAVAQITEEGWLSILRLSTKWYFNDLRKTAVDKLKDYIARMCPVERIKLAKELTFAPWLSSGYKELVTRSERVTVEVAREIGWEIAIDLCAMREGRHVLRNPPPLTESSIECMLSHDFAPINNRQPDFLTSSERLEELARKRAEEELARKRAEEEELARKRAEEEELARKRAEEEELARKRAEEEELARKRAEEEELTRKRAEEEELARKRAEEEELARKRAEEEMARKRAEEEELARKRAKKGKVEEKKLAEEQLRAKILAEEQLRAKRLAEEQELLANAREEIRAKKLAAKKRAEQEKLAAMEEDMRFAAEEEAIKRAEEEEAVKLLEVQRIERALRLEKHQRRSNYFQYKW
ncbi:hypothetical protein FA15DRAFT_463291 [Coprinopsis marcescibilis]|uniref:BTB domain-containing protein n=1 Tax=Coprinopsis marcescibilis TaxID=230819 RepID=A0A5C3KTD7_COPMA|nr:hypothetical protein FA15DRAFT_463291 [Coprinopsis marcescibilis]